MANQSSDPGVSSNPPSSLPPPVASPSRQAPDSQMEFAGWGTVEQIDLAEEPSGADQTGTLHHKLGEFASTAICGNDITSSCLYVAALCTMYAGPYAFICLAAVAAMLYLFRNIYAEVGSALPLNGGAYNALLNTTSKYRASLAACLTILSYMATACISAYEAMHYFHGIVHVPVILATLLLLGFFAFLSIIGITESAVVAIGIFVFHLATLVLLVGSAMLKWGGDMTMFSQNWATGPPMTELVNGNMGKALVFGFAAGLLGISGFESSANFIEEQKEGVFPKTLRNMWFAVAIFNPLISFLAMTIMPLSDGLTANGAAARPDFLAYMAEISAGSWLATLVSIDAVLVLSGAVLTAYVGVVGLMRRMALDRCLPQFLLRENKARKTNHWIILGFVALCCSIVLMTSRPEPGQSEPPILDILAGVYTISFLGVMALFAAGNMLLKIKRRRLPRNVKASWVSVIVALVAVTIGLIANALIDFPNRLSIFFVYFGVSVVLVTITFFSAQILKFLLGVFAPFSHWLLNKLEEVKNQKAVFFTKGDNLANLNQAALYVLQNEQMKRLKVVHVFRDGEMVDASNLTEQLQTIDKVYPQLRIDLVLVKGKFGPALIDRLSTELDVPKNYMFIGTPGDRFPHNIAELGGVRLII